MKEIHLKIEGLLKTVAALRWIDADEGQLDFYEIRPPVTYPCALIDIDYVNCRDLSEKIQQVDARIRIRLAFEPMGQTNSTAPVSVQTRALSRFDTVNAVFDTLQGWSDDEISDLSRVSQVTEKRDDNIKVIEQIWGTSFEEEVSDPE